MGKAVGPPGTIPGEEGATRAGMEPVGATLGASTPPATRTPPAGDGDSSRAPGRGRPADGAGSPRRGGEPGSREGRALRILHLRASNFYGGPERQIHHHALQARGTRYHVIIGSFDEPERPARFLGVIAADGIPTLRFAVRSGYDLRCLRDIRARLQSEAIDILCTHDYRSTAMAALAVPGTGVRWIAFSRGSTWENPKVAAYQGLQRGLIRFADRIVAVSHAERIRLIRWLVPDRRVSVVPNAIDASIAGRVPASDLRRRFDFPADTFVCIAVGRFSPEKGQRHLLAAAEEALRTLPHLRFVLLGDGPDLARIRAEVLGRGLEGKVVCPGFESDPLPAIRGADLLVNPSLSEGMPNVVLEAMALGVPVLATAVGGVPEVVRHGETGFLVPGGDERGLARGLLEAVGHPERLQHMRREAALQVGRGHSFAGQFSRMAALYARLG